MNTIRVRLFAGVAGAMRRDSTDVVVDRELTAAGLLRRLSESHPAAGGLLGRSRVAVNMEYVPADHVIRPGDDVAVVPPVSGG